MTNPDNSTPDRATNADWPFLVIRHDTGVNDNPEVFARLMECHGRHPGACDEFWFATGSRKTIVNLEKECETFARYRPLCEKAGITLSYQQGLTLGHSAAHDGQPKPGDQEFPEDAWRIDADGNRIHFLCPRSPFVLDYEREYARTVLRTVRPGSYWLDDDLRLGTNQPNGCFCERCLAAFNAKTGGNWTREELVKRLFADTPREPLRRAWSEFNAESLAVYAAVVREAADSLGSDCRLAYQAIWANATYTATDYRPLLAALSGPCHRPVGIRPGAGFYVEAEPRGMVVKCLNVAREAERCRHLMPEGQFPAAEGGDLTPEGQFHADAGNLVASICYEQETYPRHVLHKSPGAIMTECALALASGCDSLSLYWYSDLAPEPVEEYDRFLRTLRRARPYFERLAASTRRTRLGGVARFVGSAAAETPDFNLSDGKDFDLACAGIPVTVANPSVSAWYLTDKSRLEMTDEDRAALASSAVVEVDDIERYPLASRRTKLLDDLDAATGGRFPVRIDECRALRILSRVREDGRLDSVMLLNLSIGSTDEIRLRIRRPVSRHAVLQNAAMAAPVPVSCEEGTLPDEVVVTLADIPGWQAQTVFFA